MGEVTEKMDRSMARPARARRRATGCRLDPKERPEEKQHQAAVKYFI